jgi:hypothetical protein
MKKLFIIFILLVSSFSLVSCGKDKCDDTPRKEPEVTYADKWLIGLWFKADSLDEAITDFESTEYLKIYHDVHDVNGSSVSSTTVGKGFNEVHTFISGNQQCQTIKVTATIFTNVQTGRIMDIYSIQKDKNNQYTTQLLQAISGLYGQRITEKLNEDVMLDPSTSNKFEIEISIEVVDTLQSIKVTEFNGDNQVVKETEYTEDAPTEHLMDGSAAYAVVTEYYKKENNEIYTKRYLYNRDQTGSALHVLKFTNVYGFVNGYFLSLVFEPQE